MFLPYGEGYQASLHPLTEGKIVDSVRKDAKELFRTILSCLTRLIFDLLYGSYSTVPAILKEDGAGFDAYE